MRAILRTRWYPWVVVAFLVLLYTSSFIDRTILSLMVGPLRRDLAISDTQFSLLAGFSFAIMYTLAGMPVGWMVDRGSRRMLIATGCAIWSIMCAACGLATTFWQLFMARVGVGIGEATLPASSYSLLSDYFSKVRLPRAMAVFSLGIPLGSGLAFLIGGLLVGLVDTGHVEIPVLGSLRPWQVVFISIGVPGLLLAALTPLIILEPERSGTVGGIASDQQPTLRETLAYFRGHMRIYFPLTLGSSLLGMLCYSGATWFPTVLQRIHGFTPAESGEFLGLAFVFLGIPGCLVSGWLTEILLKKGRADAHVTVMKLYLTGIFLCAGLAPIVAHYALSLGMMAVLGFFCFTYAGVPAALLQDITPNRMRGQISAIFLFCVNLIGLGLGPTLIGLSTDYIFRDDAAVGKSLALVCSIGFVIAFLCFNAAGRYMRNLEEPDDEGAGSLAAA